MEIHHLSRSWTAAGVASSLVAFAVAAFFTTDVIGEYFVNTSYFFALGWWYEFTIAIVTAAVGLAVAAYTYFTHR